VDRRARHQEGEGVREAPPGQRADYDKEGSVRIKLRDADKALDMLAKHLGLFELDNMQKIPQRLRSF